MAENWYPEITMKGLVPLQVVKESVTRDEGYLESAACPYPAEVKSQLKQILGVGGSVGGTTFFEEGMDQTEALLREIDRIYTDALEMAKALGNQDASEKVQILKARASLLQKMVDLKERTINIKMISDFQSTVVEFLDQICTKDQITDLMERISK